jgi:hypothetical protein
MDHIFLPRRGGRSLTGFLLPDVVPAGAPPERKRFVRALLMDRPSADERARIQRQAESRWSDRTCEVEFAVRESDHS